MFSVHPYENLTPEKVMDAVESLGFLCDARVFPLNSYENRVYQIGIDEAQPLIGKFYRPQRWSEAAILEEHEFLRELSADDLPVVAPIAVNGQTLFRSEPFYFALFPRRGGHAPELSSDDDLELIGRWLARLHQTGSDKAFRHRPRIQPAQDIAQAASTVLASAIIPDDYRANYQSLTDDLIRICGQNYHEPLPTIRLHGDLHTGNLLLRDETLYMVDFDDCVQGPAMQDIWMLLSGSEAEQRQQLLVIKEGYEMFRPFPASELPMIEILRTRRIVHHAAWLCSRWDDPAFPAAFPWVDSHRFWSEHILMLREQVAALREPPIELPYY